MELNIRLKNGGYILMHWSKIGYPYERWFTPRYRYKDYRGEWDLPAIHNIRWGHIWFTYGEDTGIIYPGKEI